MSIMPFFTGEGGTSEDVFILRLWMEGRKLGNWETGKLGNWETGKLGNWA
jgi:hypothetical protein